MSTSKSLRSRVMVVGSLASAAVPGMVHHALGSYDEAPKPKRRRRMTPAQVLRWHSLQAEIAEFNAQVNTRQVRRWRARKGG
jgi:hypothetical protein